MKHTEQYRGRTIRVLRDDEHPVVMVEGGNAHLTVAQARRSVDHQRDRSCAAHTGACGDALAELRERGVYAGVAAEPDQVDRLEELAADGWRYPDPTPEHDPTAWQEPEDPEPCRDLEREAADDHDAFNPADALA